MLGSVAPVVNIVISSISLVMMLIYTLLRFREYREGRMRLLRECAEAVTCEAFQRCMQPTMALRFEHTTRKVQPHCVQYTLNTCAGVVASVYTHQQLSAALIMTVDDVHQMISAAVVIWEEEGYKPRCASSILQHELLTCAAHRLYGEHVDALLHNATTFVYAVCHPRDNFVTTRIFV